MKDIDKINTRPEYLDEDESEWFHSGVAHGRDYGGTWTLKKFIQAKLDRARRLKRLYELGVEEGIKQKREDEA